MERKPRELTRSQASILVEVSNLFSCGIVHDLFSGQGLAVSG